MTPSGWIDPPEHDQISTIADGEVTDTGAFVRTFWDWSSASPGVIHARARIDGVTHDVDVDMRHFRKWLSEKPFPDIAIVFIAGHRISVPANYLAHIPAQVDWVSSGRSGSIPEA